MPNHEFMPISCEAAYRAVTPGQLGPDPTPLTFPSPSLISLWIQTTSNLSEPTSTAKHNHVALYLKHCDVIFGSDYPSVRVWLAPRFGDL
jgi:hypothetical protein